MSTYDCPKCNTIFPSRDHDCVSVVVQEQPKKKKPENTVWCRICRRWIPAWDVDHRRKCLKEHQLVFGSDYNN